MQLGRTPALHSSSGMRHVFGIPAEGTEGHIIVRICKGGVPVKLSIAILVNRRYPQGKDRYVIMVRGYILTPLRKSSEETSLEHMILPSLGSFVN